MNSNATICVIFVNMFKSHEQTLRWMLNAPHRPIPRNSCSVAKLPSLQKINHRLQLMSPIITLWLPCYYPTNYDYHHYYLFCVIVHYSRPERGWYNGLSGSFSVYGLVGSCKPCYMMFSVLTEAVWVLTRLTGHSTDLLVYKVKKKTYIPDDIS